MKASEVIAELEGRRDRSAWDRGVTSYAVGMLEELGPGAELAPGGVREALLNGAKDWPAYSWGGCALVYDADIARALCAPWELRRTRGGELRPNRREEWLDVQARALAVFVNKEIDISLCRFSTLRWQAPTHLPS